MKKLLILAFVLLFSGILKAQEQQVVVPYTLADRDRLIRLEARMEAFEAKMEAIGTKMGAQESKMDVKFEAVNARIDYLFWLQGVIVALILFMPGYMIWDRRTALQPALDKASDANEKSTTLIQTLREYARKHPDLAEILRSHGIL
jgi:hypothetical protein